MSGKDPYRFFKIEAREILDGLSEAFLSLEKDNTDKRLIPKILRDAHTLKGASRLVKLSNIGEIAHILEEILICASKQDVQLQSNQIDCFLSALDRMEQMLKLLNEGKNTEIEINDVLGALNNILHLGMDSGENQFQPSRSKSAQSQSDDSPGVQEVQPVSDTISHLPEDENDSGVGSNQYSKNIVEGTGTQNEEWILVNLKQLNTMLNLSGELIINKVKLQGKRQELKEIQRFASTMENEFSDCVRLSESSEIQMLAAQSPILDKFIEALLEFKGNRATIASKISAFHDQYDQDVKLTHQISQELQQRIYQSRMVPAANIFGSFQRFVRDTAKELKKSMELTIKGGNIPVDKQILEMIKDPLMHIIRNAVDHGIESVKERTAVGKPEKGSIVLRISQDRGKVIISCEDDGGGINAGHIREKAVEKKLISSEQANEMSEDELIYMIMKPGFSTAEIVTNLSGRGIGMDVVTETVQHMNGQFTIDTEAGKYTRFNIEIPQNLASLACLSFRCGGETMLLPLSSVSSTVRIAQGDIAKEGVREVINVEGRVTPLVRLSSVLGLPDDAIGTGKIPVIIVHSRDQYIGYSVERLLNVKDVIVKNLGNHIEKITNITGVTILGDGLPIIILDPADLMQSSQNNSGDSFARLQMLNTQEEKPPILVVDDSLTTRMMEKGILESAQFNVDLAVSGEDALSKITEKDYGLFIVDIEMPGINGFDLTVAIRNTPKYSSTPIIMVSSLVDPEMKRKGINAGINAYIVKGEFDQNVLIETVDSLF